MSVSRLRRALLASVLIAGAVGGVSVATATADAAHRAGLRGSAIATDAAASAGGCQSVKFGGTLTVGVAQDVVSFDPPMTQDNGSLWADMNVYDQLVELTPNASKLVPGLARSWKVSNHGKTYLFHLRTARFSDGTPVTAQDVKFSLARAASPKAFASVGLNIIRSMKVVNAHTIVLNTSAPIAPTEFLNELALWPGSIIDATYFKKVGETAFKNHPVGSGPFAVESFKPGDEVVLKRNPYYWGTDSCHHHYPYLNQVDLKYMPNANSRVTALQGGQLDAMFNVPYNEVTSLNSGSIKSEVTPQFGNVAMSFTQKVPAFRSTDVVQAINYAIDREAIVKVVYFDHATPSLSPIDPGVDFYTGAYGYKYNLAKAKKLMKASGFKSFSATLAIPSGDSAAAATAQIVQSELKAIGGNIKILSLDPTTLNNEMEQEKLQISYSAGTSDNLDPSANAMFCCVSNGGAHSGYTGWVDHSADALFDASQTALSTAKRASLYRAWQKIQMEKAPNIWIVNPTNTFAFHTDVHGLFIPHTGHYPLWVAWKS